MGLIAIPRLHLYQSIKASVVGQEEDGEQIQFEPKEIANIAEEAAARAGSIEDDVVFRTMFAVAGCDNRGGGGAGIQGTAFRAARSAYRRGLTCFTQGLGRRRTGGSRSILLPLHSSDITSEPR